jgi:5'-methylthioadenosine phosphorylase
MSSIKIGVIGGSGLYEMEGLKRVRQLKLKTPFGAPSGAFVVGELGGREIAFLPRHDVGHRLLPSELPYRANIWGFKKLGVEWLIGIAAVGSLKEEIRPLDLVLPDQYFDRTNQGRENTFFGDGIVGHISFADPACAVLRRILRDAAAGLQATVHDGGTYINMEGPAFSTRSESRVYRQWGMDVIGMTNLFEAKLAREAEICYQTAAMVTDYDVWRSGEGYEDVSIETVIANLKKNAALAQDLIRAAVRMIPARRSCACVNALQYAIITDPRKIPAATKKRLKLIIGKYVK